MPVDIIVRYDTNGYTHTNLEKDQRGVYKKGYPVIMRDLPHQGWADSEGLPKFIIFRVTNAYASDIEEWMQNTFGASLTSSWERRLNYEVVNSNLSIDGFRLRVFSMNPGVPSINYPEGRAGIIKENVENFINNWGGSVVTFAPNSVTFDISVFNALKSVGFWEFNPSLLEFNELSYIQAGGIHQVEVDYSAIPNVIPEQAENIIIEKNGIIDNHVGNVITFTITRQDVLNEFKKEVAQAIEGTIFRRQFKVSEAISDNVAAEGGLKEVTLAQVQNYIINIADQSF